jgi:hypothetical protein
MDLRICWPGPSERILISTAYKMIGSNSYRSVLGSGRCLGAEYDTFVVCAGESCFFSVGLNLRLELVI